MVLSWDSPGTADGQFGPNGPEGITVDSEGRVYVADTMNNRVQVFDSNGTFLIKWGTTGTGPGEFRRAEDVTVDSNGYNSVSDGSNNRIQKFGYLPTPTNHSTWGHLKSLYR
ncbi:MAG: 6-bladed beta-propeller [Candidatus Kerfeldbacteria bacterium]|nr:6-bladed beta-propeller [Candidatus Kerfeldbacteria bacterium]